MRKKPTIAVDCTPPAEPLSLSYHDEDRSIHYGRTDLVVFSPLLARVKGLGVTGCSSPRCLFFSHLRSFSPAGDICEKRDQRASSSTCSRCTSSDNLWGALCGFSQQTGRSSELGTGFRKYLLCYFAQPTGISLFGPQDMILVDRR